jgi:glycosyltransferase involved in cell wall biosynthesis
MRVLFVHPNFPAQFRHVAPRLADYGWDCTFATTNTKAPDLPGVRRVPYTPVRTGGPAVPEPLAPFHAGYGHARGVYEALKARPDVKPDLVVAHSGFGSSLFLPYLYDAPVINFFEYFYRPVGQEFGYRPETPVTEAMLVRNRCRNAMISLDLDFCDGGWCPNEYQRGLMPEDHRGRIAVIAEGIDTSLYCRKPEARNPKSETTPNDPRGNDRNASAPLVLPDGRRLPAGAKVVTYVSRGFELMRGFDVFMRAAKRIFAEVPEAVFVVVGSDRVCYGGEQRLIAHRTFREHVLAEGGFDLSRFYFTGRVDEAELASILARSDLHVYLTVPFVPSWSLLNAMSCSCVVLASDQACVREYIEHGRNGLLCDFFDDEGMAARAVEVLRDAGAYAPLGQAARRTVEEHYSLDVCLPRIKRFFERRASKKREPSVRAELLARKGTLRAKKVEDTGGSPVPRAVAVPPLVPLSHCPVVSPSPATKGTVLFCWELGGGLGHMMQMLPLAEALVRRGHKVLVALRQLERAAKVFGSAGVAFLQAPAWNPVDGQRRIRNLQTFTQLLVNVGFGDEGELYARACAWRNLFKMASPDVIVFDHAPAALLASRGRRAKRVLIGSGFCCPPTADDGLPWGLFRDPPADDVGRLAAVERNVLGRVNRVLARWEVRPMGRLAQLYADVDENLLTTLPELEQYPRREAAAGRHYWGPVLGTGGGAAPVWPAGEGKRLFVYVKRFAGLAELMRVVGARGVPTVAYVDGPAEALRALAPPNVSVARERLDMAQVARECDAAVLHAGQGAAAALLLAGKPMLNIPLVMEQRLTANAVCRAGAGLVAPAAAGKDDELAAKLGAVLDEAKYADAARRVAAKYAAFDPAARLRRMVERVEGLMVRATGRVGRGKVFAG